MLDELPSRFYRKHNVLIRAETGRDKSTMSKLLSSVDISAHNWRIYVQISDLDKLDNLRIKFYLHPSFYPNAVVEVNTEPFEISGVAFGDFPFRVRVCYTWNGGVQTHDFFHLVRVRFLFHLITITIVISQREACH